MSDIFISYASADYIRIRPLIDALQKQGWSVWWDRSILPGKSWDQVLETALADARCVIAVWSQSSIQSDWVRSEADEARRRGILVPALVDDVDVPLPFRRIQAANLISWKGALPNVEFDKLAKAVAEVLSNSPTATDATEAAPARWSPSRRTLLYLGLGVVTAGATTTRFLPNSDSWRHPLPARRFVAAMIWPKLSNPQNATIARQLLSMITRELARAEAYDKDFLILGSATSATDYSPSSPAEAVGVWGANLILSASVSPLASGHEIALSVLDPANTSAPLRHETLRGNVSRLYQRSTETAAQMLGVHLGSSDAKASSEFANVQPEAYQLFTGAQEEMNKPNNDGLNSAIEKYQAAIKRELRFASAYAGLAIAYGRRFAFQREQSDLDLASQNARLALQFDPTSSRVRFSEALVKLYSGKTEDAVRDFTSLLKADPGNEEVLMYEAQAFRDMNKTELEEQVYLSLLAQRPNYWPAYNDLGLVYRGRGKASYQTALKTFLHATAIAPRAAIPWTNVAAMYLLLEKPDEARDACQRSLANHPSEDALAILGEIAYTARDYRKALDYFQRARDLSPNQHEMWRGIGDCYFMLKKPAETKQSYRKAAELLTSDLAVNPASRLSWMTLAYYAAKLNDRSKALQYSAEASRRGAVDLESQLLQAQILALFGEKKKAIDLIVIY